MKSCATPSSFLATPLAQWAAPSLSALGLLVALAFSSAAQASEAPDLMGPARRADIVSLVRQDCGSCHGMTLQGGLGPALLPATLKDKTDDYLKTVILHGLPDTAMPPWQRFLSEPEAQWIVTHLKKGFPNEP